MNQTPIKENTDIDRTPIAIRRIQTQPNLSTYPKMFAPSLSHVTVNVADSMTEGLDDLGDSCSEADSAISIGYGQSSMRHSSGSFASSTNISETGVQSPTGWMTQQPSSGNRFHILNREQVCRLCEVMERQVCINARSNSTASLQLPTLNFTLKQFLQRLRSKLQQRKIPTSSIRLNGGAARYVIYEADYTRTYNDVDLIFDVNMVDETVLEEAKRTVFETLFEFMPNVNGLTQQYTQDNAESANRTSLTVPLTLVHTERSHDQQACDKAPEQDACDSADQTEQKTVNGDEKALKNLDDRVKTTSSSATCQRETAFSQSSAQDNAKTNSAQFTPSWSYMNVLKDSYVKKMVKIMNEQDRWSLISLSNDNGRNLELKFVERIRRHYEFTVDSFHIILDSLLRFYESGKEMTEHYYPTVAAESVYGNFGQAFEHLQSRTIFTLNPEEIRGGGLLRYCRLLSEGYYCSPDLDVQSIQQLMCSRFFIDFGSIAEQEAKLRGYLDSHFPGDDNKMAKHKYLIILYQVVSESTICLMAHEMHQILSLIFCLAQQLVMEIQQDKMMKYINENLPNLQLGMSFPTYTMMRRTHYALNPAALCNAVFANAGATPATVKGCSVTTEAQPQPYPTMCDSPSPVPTPEMQTEKNCYVPCTTNVHSNVTNPTFTMQNHQTFNNFGGFSHRPKVTDGMFMYAPFKMHHGSAVTIQQHVGGNYDSKTGCSNQPAGRKIVWRTAQSLMAIRAQPHHYSGGYRFQHSTQVSSGIVQTSREST